MDTEIIINFIEQYRYTKNSEGKIDEMITFLKTYGNYKKYIDMFEKEILEKLKNLVLENRDNKLEIDILFNVLREINGLAKRW